MKRYIQITFTWAGEPDLAALRPVLNKAIDWIRISPFNWVLYTSVDNLRWYERLKTHLTDEDLLFIVELDAAKLADAQGLMPEYVWLWLSKDRSDPNDQLFDGSTKLFSGVSHNHQLEE
jgi:hypothetical protein